MSKLREAAQQLRRKALEVFDGPECSQDVRDAIEWCHSELATALALPDVGPEHTYTVPQEHGGGRSENCTTCGLHFMDGMGSVCAGTMETLALPDAQPAPARLTDEEISLAVRDKGVRCVHPGAETTIDIGRAVESAIYAKGAKQ